MFRLVLLSALVILANGAAPRVRPAVPTLTGRIVGGRNTTIEAIPYQLSLRRSGSHICGASVLSKTSALTAAHCTHGVPASRFSVRAGSTYRTSGGEVVAVLNIYPHPKFNSQAEDYDVSVLKLEKELTFGVTIRPVALQRVRLEMRIGAAHIVSGWGFTSSGSVANILQQVIVRKISDIYCKRAYGFSSVTPRMTCHGFSGGQKDACQGDSGGPLASGSIQVGVTSWGNGCGLPGNPGVYTKISNPEIHGHITKYMS